MSAISDAAQREAALDPRRSAIVQAPAGSGKTGLLIQRVLRLLATVDRPEEILAITFTRKAAAEMRRRVLEALERAADPVPPEDENARLTWTLAQAALAHDRERGWSLARNAARLRIQTIDSLSASLARQMPVLARIGADLETVDDASDLYREAAERSLSRLDHEDEAGAGARRLLKHLDGDWGSVVDLLVRMLQRRDQWLRRVLAFRKDGRATLERAFLTERKRILARAKAEVPKQVAHELAMLASYAGGCVRLEGLTTPIAALEGLEALPPTDESGCEAWQGIAELFLTKTGEWRKNLTKNEGFPTTDRRRKERMADLLGVVRHHEPLRVALDQLRNLPPARFTDEQWEVLGGLVEVLRTAAGELARVFARRNAIDYSGVAQGAVAALGEEDAPTDLLLALDVRLKHLLVDEFQDTSLGQWDLLARLTAGWMEGDGRTVFLVGDPMQSIYRFREADVALFLRARDSGLPSVSLDSLRLRTNFRSRAGVVDWVNATFRRVFEGAGDADEGAVPYADASAFHAAAPGDAVQWHAFTGTDFDAARRAEGQRVARLAREALAEDPAASVAILVRNRAHLDRILPALKKARIRFRAVDIEQLGRRPIVQDLLAITRALSHPADRVAWLALLRAPWCGLTAAELLEFGDAPGTPEGDRATVWERLGDESILARLQPESVARVRRLHAQLKPFVADRLRGSLRQGVEDAWLALGGPACAERPTDIEDAETFFDQLDGLDEAGALADSTVLEEQLGHLWAAPDVGEEARVQLMTIHKAKGLEFDTVILPGLDRIPRVNDKPLFIWKARSDGRLMMAPVRASRDDKEAAFDYLRALEQRSAEHEVGRLLYVAATRARRRLHLVGFLRGDGERQPKAPSRKSLLGQAWSVAADAFAQAELVPPLGEAEAAEVEDARNRLRRIRAEVLQVRGDELPAVAASAADAEAGIPFEWAGASARHVGTLAHRWLQVIGTEGMSRWDAARIAGLAPGVRRELERRGVPALEIEQACARVLRSLTYALEDERGRWILTAHPESRFEYRIRTLTPQGPRELRIDRLFTDEKGARWVIDYKAGQREGGEREAFLDSELERYGDQLAAYTRALPGTSAALYFPLMKAWRVAEE